MYITSVFGFISFSSRKKNSSRNVGKVGGIFSSLSEPSPLLTSYKSSTCYQFLSSVRVWKVRKNKMTWFFLTSLKKTHTTEDTAARWEPAQSDMLTCFMTNHKLHITIRKKGYTIFYLFSLQKRTFFVTFLVNFFTLFD